MCQLEWSTAQTLFTSAQPLFRPVTSWAGKALCDETQGLRPSRQIEAMVLSQYTPNAIGRLQVGSSSESSDNDDKVTVQTTVKAHKSSEMSPAL